MVAEKVDKHMILLTCKSNKQTNTQNRNRLIDTEKTLIGIRGVGGLGTRAKR